MDPIIALMLITTVSILCIVGYGAYKIGNYKPKSK